MRTIRVGVDTIEDLIEYIWPNRNARYTVDGDLERADTPSVEAQVVKSAEDKKEEQGNLF
jgi:hypothetical protein